MIVTAILTQLLATSGVTALTGQRIYYDGCVPQNVTLPYMVLTVISDMPTHSHSGNSNLNTTRIQFSIFDDSYLGVRAISSALQVAIDGYAGTMGSVYVGSCLLDNEVDISTDDNPKINGLAVDYMIIYNN